MKQRANSRKRDRSWLLTILSGTLALACYLIMVVMWMAFEGNLASQIIWSGVALVNAIFFTYSAWTGDRESFFWSLLIP